MAIDTSAYKRALYPPGLIHLSDEDIAEMLEQSAKRSRASRKAQETRRQRRAEQQTQQLQVTQDLGGAK